MDFSDRVRMARRYVGLSQTQLAECLGIRRSAVSQWESCEHKYPSFRHLQALAEATNTSFEWLATGRGTMRLDGAVVDAVPAVDCLLVEDALERRLLQAFRAAPARARVALVECIEAVTSTRARTQRRQPAAIAP
jgi:transcriptional regulator with XRE-family HTH domain